MGRIEDEKHVMCCGIGMREVEHWVLLTRGVWWTTIFYNYWIKY